METVSDWAFVGGTKEASEVSLNPPTFLQCLIAGSLLFLWAFVLLLLFINIPCAMPAFAEGATELT
jgi:hypothetical protein